MKLSERLFRRARPSCPQSTNLTPTKDRGVALVTVMTLLSVLATLSIAIFMLAGQEQRPSTAYADSVWLRNSQTFPESCLGTDPRSDPTRSREIALRPRHPVALGLATRDAVDLQS